jgi:hypothetical protein
MDKRTYYFGCLGEVGHYMHPHVRSSDFPGANFKVIQYIDGLYTPGNCEQGAAQFSMVGPFTIIAWHDYTVDKRPGSNSVIVGYGFKGTRAEIIADMCKDFEMRFPSVIKRQTAPINVIDYGIIYQLKEVTNG